MILLYQKANAIVTSLKRLNMFKIVIFSFYQVETNITLNSAFRCINGLSWVQLSIRVTLNHFRRCLVVDSVQGFDLES